MNNDVLELKTVNEVGLPLDPETFSRVILDFLGRKENLSYKSRDNFVLNLEDIYQFNHILNSKMSYQKSIVLEHFSINFGYSDGTFRQINGIEALEKFLETRSIDTTSINLTWKIIIKFDDSATIETQEINLLFITDVDIDDSSDDQFSYIELSINHTNQSWALDILNAFKEKINEVKLESSKLKKSYRNIKRNPFYLTLLAMVFITCSIGLIVPISPDISQNLKQDLIRYTLKQEHKDEISKLISLLHVTALDKNELKSLKNNNDEEIKNIIFNNNKETVIHLVLIIMLMLVPFVIKKYLKYSINYLNNKSFILISKSNIKNFEKYNEDKSKVTYIGFTVIVSSILFSIVAGIIFKILEKLVVL
jgi:hypothetical protein